MAFNKIFGALKPLTNQQPANKPEAKKAAAPPPASQQGAPGNNFAEPSLDFNQPGLLEIEQSMGEALEIEQSMGEALEFEKCLFTAVLRRIH